MKEWKNPIKGFLKGAGINLRFQLNPPEWSINKTLAFASLSTPGARSPEIQYSNGEARSISISLYFDSRMAESVNVEAMLAQLEELQSPPDGSAPKIVTFGWGALTYDVYIESLDITRIEFSKNLEALKAGVDLKLVLAYDQHGNSSASSFASTKPIGTQVPTQHSASGGGFTL